MRTRILEYIVCPLCGCKLSLMGKLREKEELKSGRLCCKNKHSFNVAKGIPKLLRNEENDKDKKQIKDSFSYKWDKFEESSFEKSVIESKRKWYIERYGWKCHKDFEEFISSKKYVLDAGTGLGRDAAWFSDLCRGEIFGVDISRSVEIAQKRFDNKQNLYLIQADLTKLPFRKGFFDFISCDQVIHHTPDPRAAFMYLTEFLKKGGDICVYTYKKKPPVREFCDDYIRRESTNMTIDDCMSLSKSLTLLGKSLSELNVEFEVLEDIPLLEIKAGRYDLQRFIYWNFLKCFWNENMGLDHSIAVNFDWYHPKYAYRYTPEEIKDWIEEAGLEIANFDIVPSGISVRAQKL